MSIAPYWRQLHDHRWAVAQVRADLEDVVNVLLASGEHVEKPLPGNMSPFQVTSELMVPMMLYRRTHSDWSFIEGVYGVIGCDLNRISSELGTDVLYASYEDNVGAALCAWFRNGTLCREYLTGPAEFIDPSSDCYDDRTMEGVPARWQVNHACTARVYDATGAKIDIDGTSFNDHWEGLTGELDLDVPPSCWDHDPRALTVSSDLALTDVLQESARLLDMS